MIKAGRFIRSGAVLVCSMVWPALAAAGTLGEDLLERMSRAAPGLDQDVLARAFNASRCAIDSGMDIPERLAIIDFSMPSSHERLWIFDLSKGDLMLRDLVAHGKNSGNVESTTFSNIEGSHQSSLGLFLGSESYYGKHGYSLRLDGLEPGINDQARQRAIVIHGADYVNESWVSKYGRIGRSHGCPAVDNHVIEQVVDNLKGGQFVFKYYPDQRWLNSSEYLNCGQGTVARQGGGAHQG